jgi:hypothetical protein
MEQLHPWFSKLKDFSSNIKSMQTVSMILKVEAWWWWRVPRKRNGCTVTQPRLDYDPGELAFRTMVMEQSIVSCCEYTQLISAAGVELHYLSRSVNGVEWDFDNPPFVVFQLPKFNYCTCIHLHSSKKGEGLFSSNHYYPDRLKNSSFHADLEAW